MIYDFNESLSEEQLKIKETLIKEITKDYDGSAPKTIPSISSIPVHTDIDGFIDSVAALVDMDQIHADQKVVLLDNYDRQNIFQDFEDPTKEYSGVVLYSMIRRAPGTMTGGNTYFAEGRREVKPRIRAIEKDPITGQANIYYSQWFDNEVLLEVCARTNKRANELANWFEDLMEKNRIFFALKGITKYNMDRREADKFLQIGNDGVESRPFVYMLRTEKTYMLTEQMINKIVVSLTTSKRR